MPQIYNLGGVTIQRMASLDVTRIYTSAANQTIMDTQFQSSAAGVAAYKSPPFKCAEFWNIEYIISKTGKEVSVDRIKESTN